MTYASHARVITGIIQANLIHLSIKMTTPHQSGAPFVGERVFQNRGVCGQAFPSFPSPTPFLQPFCSRPIFARPGCEKLVRAARISFASYGNACYAGYGRLRGPCRYILESFSLFSFPFSLLTAKAVPPPSNAYFANL